MPWGECLWIQSVIGHVGKVAKTDYEISITSDHEYFWKKMLHSNDSDKLRFEYSNLNVRVEFPRSAVMDLIGRVRKVQ